MSVSKTLVSLLLAVSLASVLRPATGQTTTCPNSKHVVLYNRACCNFIMNLATSCCISTNDCYCAANKRPIDFWPPSACFPTTPPPTTIQPSQPLLCPTPITKRLLGGKVITETCQDRGVIGFYFNATNLGADLSKICHGVYSFDAEKSRRVLRMFEYCWKLLLSLETTGSGYGGILLRKDFALKAAYMEGITTFGDLVPTNGYVTMYPDPIMESYLDSKVNSSCSNVACELGYNSVPPDQINFSDCKIMSYGAVTASSTLLVPKNYVLKSVAVKMFLSWGGTTSSPCQTIIAEQNGVGGPWGNVTPVCFVSKNSADANCGMTDSGAPMYCKTLDGREDVFVGFNGFSSFNCQTGPVNAFAIHPFP